MPITLRANPAEDTQVKGAITRSRKRTPFQLEVDAVVKPMVAEWESKGKPEPLFNEETGKVDPNPEAPTYRYTIDKGDRSEMKEVVRRACTLFKAAPYWYLDQENEGDLAGTITIKFAPMSPPPKPEKVAEGSEDGQAPQGQEGGQEGGDQAPQGTGDLEGDQEGDQESERTGRRGR